MTPWPCSSAAAAPQVRRVVVDDCTEVDVVANDTSGNPSDRRDALAVRFWCEGCAAEPVLTIAQHKGQSLLHWADGEPGLPRPSDTQAGGVGMSVVVTTTPVVLVDFDYTRLDPGDADHARDAAKRIRERTSDAAIENGRDLIEIKKRLEHGAFLQWLRAEVEVSERTAQNMMAAASWSTANPQTLRICPCL